MPPTSERSDAEVLAEQFELPCGAVLKNRIAKAAMSDSLGDGAGNPSEEQVALYRRWSDGGAALALIGEIQVGYRFPEKPGNLVFGANSDEEMLARLAEAGRANGAQLWPQLGHAGALADARISTPAGPSALDVDGLRCDALTLSDIEALPAAYANAARVAREAGFGGVEIHAGHGFLLSQFLSPLFNHRTDNYGGSIGARGRIIVDIINEVRSAVGTDFAIAIKMNSSDQLEGGLTEDDALAFISLLDDTSVDLVEISGGTYFPGAASSSDRASAGPYFVDFARRARSVTKKPLMATGGFKSRAEAAEAVSSGATDMIGLARSIALDPDIAAKWVQPDDADPQFPRFESPPVGGVTAWFTMRLTALAEGTDDNFDMPLDEAIARYDARDAERVAIWNRAFNLGE